MHSDSLRILTRETRQAFRQTLGHTPELISACPGRLNIIGDHTDYNYGYVLPIAVDRWCVCVAEPLGEPLGKPLGSAAQAVAQPLIRIRSLQREGVAEIPLNDTIKPAPIGDPSRWANTIRGVIHGFLERGIQLPSLEIMLNSELPPGGGLASSSAVSVSFATLLEGAAQMDLDPLDLALLCQKAEQDFAGIPCGIMDQYVCCHAQAERALLLDCESLTHRHVQLNSTEWTFLYLDSGVHQNLADGRYAQRRQECEDAAAALGLRKLRHAHRDDLTQLDAHPLLQARARFITEENERTLAAARLLGSGQWQKLGQLMNESQRSMQEEFAISLPELDDLAKLAQKIPLAQHILGARITGGGFGGSMVYLVAREHAEAVAQELMQFYAQLHPEPAARSTGWLASLPTGGTSLLSGH